MSRRQRAVKREIPADPQYGSATVSKFVNSLMLDGKKSTAEGIFYEAMRLIEERAGQPAMNVFKQAVNNVKPVLEVKSRRVGGATYQVPVEVAADRQFALALRWLVDFADARKGQPMKEALAAEILEAYQGQGNAIRKRDEVHKMAQANKAFAHFRW